MNSLNDARTMEEMGDIALTYLCKLIPTNYVTDSEAGFILSASVQDYIPYSIFNKALNDTDESKTLMKIICVMIDLQEDGIYSDKIIRLFIKEIDISELHILDQLHQHILHETNNTLPDLDGYPAQVWIKKLKLHDFISERDNNTKILMESCPINAERIVWHIMNKKHMKTLMCVQWCGDSYVHFFTPFAYNHDYLCKASKLEEAGFDMSQIKTKDEVVQQINDYINEFNKYLN